MHSTDATPSGTEAGTAKYYTVRDDGVLIVAGIRLRLRIDRHKKDRIQVKAPADAPVSREQLTPAPPE